MARDALSGYVEKSVGTATFYHADYVLPKWAFQLGKVAQLGRHIFYRFTGTWGTVASLNGNYSGLEIIPAINFGALHERLASEGKVDLQMQLVPGLSVAPNITDRHTDSDVGGRLDVTKQWRLSIPDPGAASSRYRQTIATDASEANRLTGIAHLDKATAVEP